MKSTPIKDQMEVDQTNDSFEDEKFETETSRSFDFLLTFFQHGLHHILEKIFLSLPPRSVLSCQKVSSGWREMTNFYQNSENPRIKRILEMRLNQEWFGGNPIIESFPMPGGDPSCRTFQHLVMDDSEVAIVGLYSDNSGYHGEPVIHILDSKTLRLKTLIHVRSYIPENDFCIHFNLALTEKYLFLTGIKAVGFNSKQYFWAAWQRQNDFAFSGLHFREIFPLPMTNWSLGPRACTTEIVLKPFYEETSFPKLSVKLISKSTTFLYYKVQLAIDTELLICSRLDLSRVSLISSGNKIWVKTKSKQMRLVGFNEEFVCISCQNEDLMENTLEVYQIDDGRLIQRFDLGREFRAIYKAQISHGRMAVKGITADLPRKFDVFVFDLKTGKKLLRCSSIVKDAHLEVDHFVLAKDRIVFLERINWPKKRTTGRIFSAKFWV